MYSIIASQSPQPDWQNSSKLYFESNVLVGNTLYTLVLEVALVSSTTIKSDALPVRSFLEHPKYLWSLINGLHF